jgi:hypothetical protein
MSALHLCPYRVRPLSAVFVLSVLTANAPAQVVTSVWNGATGNWIDPTLWSPAVPNNGTPPGATYNATVNGTGTLTVNSDIGIQQLTFPQGTINLQAGTLTANNTSNNGGAIIVGSGATLRFSPPSATSSTFGSSSSITGAGTVRFINSNLSYNGTYNVSGTTEITNGQMALLGTNGSATMGALALNGMSTIGVGSTLTVNGPMMWSGGEVFNISGAPRVDFVLNGGGAFTGTTGNMVMSSLSGFRATLNHGETIWSGGNIVVGPLNSLTNAADSILTITGDNMIRGTELTQQFSFVNNAGLIRKVGGTGTTQLGAGRIAITNTGSIDALSGTLNITSNTATVLNSPTINQGMVTIGPGATANGPFTNNAGGVVRGTGTLGQEFTGFPTRFNNGSTLSPGINGPGTLTATAPLALSAGARFAADLNGTTPGTGYDRLALAAGGTIDLAGATLATSLGYKPTAADVLAILVGAGSGTQLTGTFANATPGSVIFVGTFDGTDYDARINYTPNSVFLDNFQVVPEPTTLALTAFAVGAGVVVRVRRRKK